MTEAQSKERAITSLGIYWLVGLGLLFATAYVTKLFDNSTELTPDHSDVGTLCFVGGAVVAIASMVVGFQTVKLAIWRRVGIAFSIGLIGFLGVFILSWSSSNIIEGFLDFPQAKTRTFTGLIYISRAYATHGKGRSWNIQTTPLWSNIDVTEPDYRFMLTHRRPGDNGTNPDKISSKRYFCARVTIQQAGDAIRVLHAGSQKLPEGSVIICPAAARS